MRVGLLGDEFQHGFVIQGGLFRLCNPSFPQRLQTCQIVWSSTCNSPAVARRASATSASLCPACRFLLTFPGAETPQWRPRLRADGGVNGARRNCPPRQRHLRFEHVPHRARKIRRRLRRDHEGLGLAFSGGRKRARRRLRGARAKGFCFAGFFGCSAATKTNQRPTTRQQEHGNPIADTTAPA